MIATIRLLALFALVAVTVVSGVASSDQSFVVIGDEAIAMQEQMELSLPTILLESEATTEVEQEIMNPFMAQENQMIQQNQALLANVELLAHQLHAPVLSEIVAEQSEHEVEHIEHSLLQHPHEHSNVVMLPEVDHLENVATSFLEAAPVADTPVLSAEDADIAAMEREVAMVELGAEVSAPRAPLDKKNDYAFLDDPKHGGQPTVLKNLRGLDIYVVNTQVADNDNEIRPVKPPHPMSASMREKARLAAIMRKQLIHDIPQPKAAIKPKTRINTLSAYESSLVPSKPLRKMSRLSSRNFDHPIVGGQGAMQLRGVVAKGAQARFQQLPGTPALPVFPKDPNAAPIEARKFGTGSSFDNRDGPPALLDDLLPIKATLVEELDPLHIGTSQPNW